MTRAVAGIVVTLPVPAISDGRPSLPLYWAKFAATATLLQGPLHIHAIPDPNPVWDPRTSGWTHPPPKTTEGGNGVGDCRWNVDSLPDPGGFSRGWYWLGDPTSQDGTAGIAGGCRQWNPTAGSNGPTWRSFFPYKPSVNGYDAQIEGERQVHHAKGVHFNSHYAEHMFADFGGTQSQPFTWVVAATVMSDPFGGYQHWILDSGRNPDDVGFPRLSASAVSQERQIGDNLPYRTGLLAAGNTAKMLSSSGDSPLAVSGAPGHHPRMFVAIFDGAQSRVAVYDPFGKYTSVGTVSNGPQQAHRFMVVGREHGWISQSHASNILIFEMRYWRHALLPLDLEAQYAQLSSTYQFDAYKTL